MDDLEMMQPDSSNQTQANERLYSRFLTALETHQSRALDNEDDCKAVAEGLAIAFGPGLKQAPNSTGKLRVEGDVYITLDICS